MWKIKDKRGQGIFLQIAMAIVVWFGGVMAFPLMQDIIDGARTGLSCATPAAISDGTKLLCLVMDTGVLIIFWTMIVIIGAIILGNKK